MRLLVLGSTCGFQTYFALPRHHPFVEIAARENSEVNDLPGTPFPPHPTLPPVFSNARSQVSPPIMLVARGAGATARRCRMVWWLAAGEPRRQTLRASSSPGSFGASKTKNQKPIKQPCLP
jgi:hypothetical protein